MSRFFKRKSFRIALAIIACIGIGYISCFFFFYHTADELTSTAWLEQLPDCPCEQPKATQLNDGWAVDIGDREKHHPGAALCFRSFPAIATAQGLSGQQCCYDDGGMLIIDGAGAGTPDRESSCGGESEDGTMQVSWNGLFFHYFKDVLPGGRMSGASYRELWAPNTGDCNEE